MTVKLSKILIGSRKRREKVILKKLLYNAGIVTMNTARDFFTDGAILIDGDRIIDIDKSAVLNSKAHTDVEKIDCRGKYILPGMINTHVHTSQQLGRGIADDVNLLTWLHKRIWPYESNLTEEDSYISTLLCGLEQIRSGVTCFAEAGGQFVDGMVRGTNELGIRGILAQSIMDTGKGLPDNWKSELPELLGLQTDYIKKWHGSANDRIRIWFGLRTIFNVSDDLIVKTKALADREGVGIHMHVAEVKEEVEFSQKERGATTVSHLNNLGVLGPNLLAVHCVWMTDEEVDLFASHGVKVSHNPASAMRVLGFAKIPEMMKAGVCVTLGTDGAPSNNRMTLIDEMWLASLIHKGRTLDPTVVPAQAVLEMVTCNAARALMWEKEIGTLEIGKKADLVLINPDTPTMLPMHDPIANMVTSMHDHNVESVMVDGRWIMRDRKILVVDEAAVILEAKERAANVVKRAGIVLPPRFNTM
jgi:5-methylthioadenosine/S-adenosylhomocysteine deaminase